MQQNPTQSESIKGFVIDGVKAGKYVLCNGYFLSNLGFTILGILVGIEFLVVTIYGSPIHLVIAFGLIALAMAGIRQDLKEMKRRKGKITRSFAILVFVFVYVSTYSDAFMLEMDILLQTAEGMGTDEVKEKLVRLDFQVELLGIFMYFPYPIFFYGNEIWRWITKKQAFLNHYESYLYYQSG